MKSVHFWLIDIRIKSNGNMRGVTFIGKEVAKYLQGHPSGSFDPFKYVGIVILFVLSNEEASLVRFFAFPALFSLLSSNWWLVRPH